MSRARLFLSGIRAEGRHGARAGEKDVPQPFVVDLDIEVDAADDSIDSTADYRVITDAVREIIEHGSFDLIEAMADAIAGRISAFPRVEGGDRGGPQAERRRTPRDRRGGRRGHRAQRGGVAGPSWGPSRSSDSAPTWVTGSRTSRPLPTPSRPSPGCGSPRPAGCGRRCRSAVLPSPTT